MATNPEAMSGRKHSLLDVKHPMFRPVWVRALIVGVFFLWTLVEVRNGQTIWAAIFAVAVGYLFWQFFIAFNPSDYTDEDDN